MQKSFGFAAPGYEGVLDLFEALLAADPQYSAQLAAYRDGVKIVDLFGGPHITADSITGAYSVSKGVAALVISLLVQDGLLDLDRTVAHYWPEFGCHALTIGIIMEELCRRVTGTSLQSLYDQRIRMAYGIDFFLGLPEELEPRYRDVLYDVDPLQPWLDPLSLDGLNSNAAVSSNMELPNQRTVRAEGMSAAGGVGTAEGLARLYTAATTGVDGRAPLLTPETVSAMSQEQVWGLDRMSGLDNAFAVVFMKPHVSRNFGSHRAFGHEGAKRCPGVCRSRVRARLRIHPAAGRGRTHPGQSASARCGSPAGRVCLVATICLVVTSGCT
ncbi:serine hydrolase domain-containing protein [Pseudarthrobacter sp. NBSH8]|uniref:serine hydrolase domain-containing protein n=1 Tax=Pseudarthrobacter sp. NBSH8 TaxID=2596911 RepID=UPI00351BD14A